MRVLLLTPGFVAEDGPACVPALIDLLTKLKARHDLDLHAIIPPPALRGRVERRGLSIRGYGNRSRSARLADLIGYLSQHRSYDLVWCLWIDRTGWAGALASRLLRRPLLLSAMASELADPPIHDRLALKALARAARRVTVGSRFLERRFRDLCPGSSDRVRHVPLGIPPLDQPTERPRRNRLLAVTNLTPVKQPRVLLQAIASLADRGRDVTLDVYGYASSADLDRLHIFARELGISERVHHFGFIEPAALRAIYRDYDGLLHASSWESQGMALIEAAAAGLPIACFDVGVARELAELGATVSIAEEDLGAAALIMLDAPRAHSDRVIARFSLERTTADFEAVLDEAAA